MMLGQMTHTVWLELPGQPVPDGQGGYTDSWTALTPPYWKCAIAPAAGANLERQVVNTIEASASHLLTGPVHPGLADPTTAALVRVTVLDPPYGGRRFDVRSVQLSPAPPYQHLVLCSEVLSDPTGGSRAA